MVVLNRHGFVTGLALVDFGGSMRLTENELVSEGGTATW